MIAWATYPYAGAVVLVTGASGACSRTVPRKRL